MSDQVKNIGVLVAHPNKREELRALLEGLIAPSRSEPGNLRYDLWQDATNSDRFVLDELYVDQEAFEAHKATSHFQAYKARIGDLAEREAFALKPATVG